MIQVVNRIEECQNTNWRKLQPSRLEYLATHRISLKTRSSENPNPIEDEDLNAREIAKRFKNRELGTGGLTPYHIAILTNAVIEQLIPLGIKGAHVSKHNWRSIGVALVGDFREKPPTIPQTEALLWVCKTLAPINGGLLVAGHGSMPGATKDCPGEYLKLGPIVAKVHVCEEPHLDVWHEIERAGFVL